MGKDPNCPKKPLTAYFRYVATIRKEVEAETGMKGVKIAKHLATRWKAVTAEEKAPFEAPVKPEMEEWKTKMAAYKKTRGHYDFQEAATKKKYKKQPKDKNAPKRPMTSFFLYANSVRDDVVKEMGGKMNVAVIGKKIGGMWKTVSAEEKAMWVEKQKIAKEAYVGVYADYKNSANYALQQKNVQKFHSDKAKAYKSLAKLRKTTGVETAEEAEDIEEEESS